jgi:hypothetical protein
VRCAPIPADNRRDSGQAREDRFAMRLVAIALVPLLALWGCGKRADSPAGTMSEAHRDSVIARSSLPGASAVDRALALSGRAEDRAARIDSLAR